MLSLLLACVGLSRLEVFASFSRVSSVLCFGCPRGFHALLWETLLAHVAWRHRGSSPLLWSRWVRYSVVLRLWHGLGLLWLVSLWESSGPASRSALRALERAVTSSGAQESYKREKSERARALDIAHRRLVQSERRYGAEPRLHDILARHFHVTKNNFLPLY